MRNRQIPPEAQLYSAAFDAYLRAAPDGRQEQEAAARMATTLSVLAEARLSREPVRVHGHGQGRPDSRIGDWGRPKWTHWRPPM